MNIEDIKERLNNLSKCGIEGYAAKEHFQVNAESDIEYLLSIIEQQNETFDKLIKHAEDETVVNLHFSQLFVRRVCLDALQAIRK